MLFSTWLRNWKRSLECRSALMQTRRRKSSVRRVVPQPRLEALEDRTLLSAYVVTTTADSGAGSLRDAIDQINADTSHALYASPSNPNVDEIDFNITADSNAAGYSPGQATGFNANTGVATIAPQTALPQIYNAVVINGYTQAGASQNTLLGTSALGSTDSTLHPENYGDNAVLKVELDGENAGTATGLDLEADNVTVQGLVINRFANDGIFVAGNGDNVIEGNFLGTDVAGNQALGNDTDVVVHDWSSNDTIGGTTPAARNIISGASGIGINLASEASQAVMQGNFIGTDVKGRNSLANASKGIFNQGFNNLIGGSSAGAGNVISGNGGDGIRTANAGENVIEGNFIGTDVTGTKSMGNTGDGIHIGSLGSETVGASAAGNLISDNGGGIFAESGNNNVIQGNFIGTDVTGTQALENPYTGIIVQGNNNLIGGLDTNAPGAPLAGAGNVIVPPVHADAPAIGILSGSGNLIEGNYIGTDITGTQVLGNDPAVGFGDGASGNTVGGTTAATRNIMAATYIDPTISFGGTATSISSNNVVEGNYIGIGATGAQFPGNSPVLGNFSAGVLFKDYASNNTIGGTAAGAGNVIAGSYWGILTHASAGTVGNSFLGNSIFGNSFLGIELDGGNDDQAAPVLATATSSAASTTISGTLASVPNTTFRIEFFANADLDASGNAEGLTYLGYTTVTTDSNGNATFTATNLAAIPIGQGYLTATATNQSTGDTSQFSNYLTAPTSTVLTSSANPSLLNQSVTFKAAVYSSFGTPRGSVDFVDTTTGTDLGTVALSSNATASITESNLALGAHVIKATYAGQGSFLGSSGTLTQQVSYNFSGFLPPVSNGLNFAVNRTIPIKFTLSDYNGNAITSLSAITSLQIQVLDANGNPVGAPFNPIPTNNQGLQFSGGQYQFNWQTKGLAAGSYEIVLKLADGTTQTKTIHLTAGGSSAGLVTNGSGGTATAGALLGGEVDLYIDNSNGDLASDELTRINDAVTSIDATIAPYGVSIVEVTDPTQANVTLSMNMSSSLGGFAQGVLGCTTDADEVTMIQGWNWYAGADPTQVGSGQYDFETAVMHELGHVLGLGHSSDSSSVMYASLSAGTANRTLVTADLNIPDDDSGPCALHAAPAVAVGSSSNRQSMTVSSSPSSSGCGRHGAAADQVLASLSLLLSEARNAYQSELSSVSALWQGVHALALQRLDSLLSLEAGAMGMSKDTLMNDLFFASLSISNG